MQFFFQLYMCRQVKSSEKYAPTLCRDQTEITRSSIVSLKIIPDTKTKPCNYQISPSRNNMLCFFGKGRFYSFTVLLQVHTFQMLNRIQATSFSKGTFLMHKKSERPCRFILDHLGEKLNGLENYHTISWTKWAFWSLKQEGNEKSLSNQIRYLPE